MSEQEIREEIEQKIELVEKEQKFSIAKFAVGWAKIITSMSFLAWLVYTVLFVVILSWIFSHEKNPIEYLRTVFLYILAGGWVSTTFVMAVNLQKGIETMFSNAKITAEFKAGFSKNGGGEKEK